MKTNEIKIAGNKTKSILKNEIKSYANDPFFVKKGKESKEFLDRVGFPEELVGK